MEIMLNHFTYNGKSSAELGLIVNGVNIYGSASRVVDKVQVPYRNGNLLLDTGAYNNYIVSYTVGIINNTKATAEAISEWLLAPKGYNRLEDTYNTDYYRMATYYNQLDYTLSMLYRYGSATISFDCKPQKFLVTGDLVTTLTANGSLVNPSLMVAKPLVRVYGTGAVTINGTTVTVNSVDSYVDIDCEAMQCRKGDVNCGNNVTLTDYPTLTGGTNQVYLASTITKVEITPRWWKI